ncbi:hypothetical protein [Asanoa siamensis]|uniref:Membrane protein YesL n=1 Tax=Asanoa siamensis TaxID=926357 RepID=A0ABQ4CVA6_9ACTN|nr:hypothetical protein [Asanoa siamensis]GIF75205.1 hypothetical protein Asi02nite_47230 [Asanoa siamensis]
MRPDWRDTVRVATDVALLGLLMVAASLPVLTTGATFATASFAVDHFLTHDRWPRPRALWPVFRRALLPGAVATVVAVAVIWLLVLDLRAVASGTVPGGAVLLGVTAVIAAAAAGYAALALVTLGTLAARTAEPGGSGWWRAAARGAAGARPGAVAAATGVVGLAGLLAVLVHPILAACLVGYALYALHVVGRRLAPAPATRSA